LRSQSVDQTSNEITALPEFVKKLEPKGAIITMNAMWNQKDIAALIVDGGGDYMSWRSRITIRRCTRR
jgi:predicted transposase YbfD/YdcC